LKGARLLALCSPLNPTGTTFTAEELAAICDLVLAENASRGNNEKPLYVLYDQIYWTLTYGTIEHVNPVSLRPDMRKYTVFVDGISKAFASTGVRVGWGMGPEHVIAKMKAINSHVGAWAPMAEQRATQLFLERTDAVSSYLDSFKEALEARLVGIYEGFMALKAKGYPVDAIAPQAAIYLTIKIDLVGKTTAAGKKLESQRDVTAYLLDEAHLAVVPFSAFGAPANSPWYRLSVGTCKLEDIPQMLADLEQALS
jgi:aspartate aminotransferase